jgi:hypothetical protein
VWVNKKGFAVDCVLRTNTAKTALYVALKKLGYTCYHMAECGRDAANDSLTLWHAAIDAKYYGKGRKFEGEDFDKMLWRYDVRAVIFYC